MREDLVLACVSNDVVPLKASTTNSRYEVCRVLSDNGMWGVGAGGSDEKGLLECLYAIRFLVRAPLALVEMSFGDEFALVVYGLPFVQQIADQGCKGLIVGV